MGFTQYLQLSLQGVFVNALFIGLILGILVQDIRNYKYFRFERWVIKEGFEWDMLRALLYLFSYVVAVPLAILALIIIIFFLWVLSIIGI